MGRDKAVLDWRGARLLEVPLAALDAVAGEVWIASGAQSRFPDLGRECVLDAVAGGGPLAGLSAGLERCDTHWLAVLACDLPYAHGRVLEHLLAHAQNHELDACLLRSGAGPEPLFAVYASTCREAVRAALARGERRMISFHDGTCGARALRIGAVDVATLDPRDRACALNLNTIEEYEYERTHGTR